MVVELCSGGSLDELLACDQKLPVNIIRDFTIDICKGLHYLHSNMTIHGDLTPKNIYLDGMNNMLKISNFNLSQRIHEDLGTTFLSIDKDCNLQEMLERDEKYRPVDEHQNSNPNSGTTKTNNVQNLAPKRAIINTFEGDMYSLGCIIYEMTTGCHPTLDQNPTENSDLLQKTPESQTLHDLIKRLLEPDPTLRMRWRELLIHPFFNDRLQYLISENEIINDSSIAITEQLLQSNLIEKDQENLNETVADSIAISISEPHNQIKANLSMANRIHDQNGVADSQETVIASSDASEDTIKPGASVKLNDDYQVSLKTQKKEGSNLERIDSDAMSIKSYTTQKEKEKIVESPEVASNEKTSKTHIPTPRLDAKSADVYKKKQRHLQNLKNFSNQNRSRDRSNLNSQNKSRKGSDLEKNSGLEFLNLSDFDHSEYLDNLLRCNSPPEILPCIDNTRLWKFNLVPHHGKFVKNISGVKSSINDIIYKIYSNIPPGSSNAPTEDDYNELLKKINEYFASCSPNERTIHYLLEAAYHILLFCQPEVTARFFPIVLKYLQYKNSPNKFEVRIRAAKLLARSARMIPSDARLLDGLNILMNELRSNNAIKNIKNEFRCYLLSSLIDTANCMESDLISDGKMQVVLNILLKNCAASFSALQAIALKGMENLNLYNSISTNQISAIWSCLRHANNDLVKVTASKVLWKCFSYHSGLNGMTIESPGHGPGGLYNNNNLNLIVDHLEISYPVKMTSHMTSIVIDLLRHKKEIHINDLIKIYRKLQKLLDSPNLFVRGKVYIALAIISSGNNNLDQNSTLTSEICTAKVIATVEREIRRIAMFSLKERTSSASHGFAANGRSVSSISRGSSRKGDSETQDDIEKRTFLSKCLNYFGNVMCQNIAQNLDSIVDLFNPKSVDAEKENNHQIRLSKSEQKFTVKTLHTSVHLTSSNIFKKLFIHSKDSHSNPDSNSNSVKSKLASILSGIVSISKSTSCTSWFDEIAIELLVIIQSIVETSDNKIITLLMKFIAVQCVSSDPPKSLAIRIVCDLLESKINGNKSRSDFQELRELLVGEDLLVPEVESGKSQMWQPARMLIDGVRDAIFGVCILMEYVDLTFFFYYYQSYQ